MPHRQDVFAAGHYYHIYNRGADHLEWGAPAGVDA